MTVDELNAVSADGFVKAVGFVAEHSPWVALRAAGRRPFSTAEGVAAAFDAIIAGATADERLGLLKAHPDLAGKAAVAADLTAESRQEQASAGLDAMSPAEHERFQALNAAYRERFGFPFVICVREHTRASILDQFDDRLRSTAEAELETGLREVCKIIRLRLVDAVSA